MSDDLVLEIMRAIRGDLTEPKPEQRVEPGGRFDRILDRLETIERHLDLRDA